MAITAIIEKNCMSLTATRHRVDLFCENKNQFKKLDSLKLLYHFCKSLFKTWKNLGSYMQVFTVSFFDLYSLSLEAALFHPPALVHIYSCNIVVCPETSIHS